jgi:plasmid stabilization system protein ParE
MYKLLVTELAHQDLDNIVSYIAVQLANPKAAGDFLDEVTTCYGFLKTNPMMYERCQERQLEKEGYHKAVIKNYVLIYKIDKASNDVSIMRFFYGAQDYTKLI